MGHALTLLLCVVTKQVLCRRARKRTRGCLSCLSNLGRVCSGGTGAADDRPYLTRNQTQKPHTEYGVGSRFILTPSSPSSQAFYEFSNSEDSKHPGLAGLLLATTQKVKTYLQWTPYGGCTSAFSQVPGSCMTCGVEWKIVASNRRGFGGEGNGPADRQYGRKAN